jgi:hypothetical protein
LALTIKTQIKAGGLPINHNETVAPGPAIRTQVGAAGVSFNHNETVVPGPAISTFLARQWWAADADVSSRKDR